MRWEITKDTMNEEILAYAKIISKKNQNRSVTSLILTLGSDESGEYIDVTYALKSIPFDRIRITTGYFNRFEDRKQVKNTSV